MGSLTLYWRLKSYLPSRNRVAQVNGYIPHPAPVNIVVIQDSVLGQLQFLLYINEVFSLFIKGIPFPLIRNVEVVCTHLAEAAGTAIAGTTQDIMCPKTRAKKWTMKFSTKRTRTLRKTHLALKKAKVWRLNHGYQ